MSITERILNGVRDLLRQQDKIDSLTEAVKELTTELRRLDTEVREMDRRLVRIEAMMEVALSRSGHDRLPPADGND